MTETVTPLADGGRVEASWTSGGQLHLQKYDASGTPVGEPFVSETYFNAAPQIAALANGGYVAMAGFVFRGGEYLAYVFGADGAKGATIDVPGSGIGATLIASPDGGFLIASTEQHAIPGEGSAGVDYAWRPYLTLYDNQGATVSGPAELAGDLPTLSVLPDGRYQAEWQDGDISRSLTIDPANPPSFDRPPAPDLTLIDDQGARTGPITGQFTTDATPVARVTVSEVGTVLVTRELGGNPHERTLDGGVAVTAEDVARGYVDIVLPAMTSDGMPGTWYARFKDANGVVSDADAKGVNVLLRPEIWSVSDDAGPATGALADGATTDDATPTVRIGLESSGLAAGDTVKVLDTGGAVVGQASLTAADVGRGYVDVTTTNLTDGAHALTAGATPMAPFHLTVAAASSGTSGSSGASGQVVTSGQYGDTLQGGAGDDTLNAGQGPDMLTGGSGGDAFVFGALPWNAGHVTDFATGEDRLDLSALFQAYGYSGPDPVADGWVSLRGDGGGGTQVYFDTNGPASGGDWPFLITTLDGAAVSTWAQVAGPGGSSTPPAEGGETGAGGGEGEVLTSSRYGDTLLGGAGDDTLNAGQGPDRLTGAGGADRFVWGDLPWNAGHVTDFAPGTDKLDLRPLFTAAGYSGGDPVADGHLQFRPDGAGNTQVYFDRDAVDGGDWPFLIATLDGVTPAQIGADDWLF